MMYFRCRIESSLLLADFSYEDNIILLPSEKFWLNRFMQLQQHLGTRTQVRSLTTYLLKL